METKELNEKLKVLEASPIRQYVKLKEGVTLFEEEKTVLAEIDNIININKENLNNPLKIVVLGEVKAGKSTLVNALVGRKVSYTNVVEATAAILEIKYSSKEKVIIQYKNKEKVSLASLKELDNLIDLNKDDQEFFGKIEKISIFTNTERLREITLVDTPGLNTVTAENAERTDNYIANADVILWILNSHHLGQSDISAKIEEVLDFGKPIICVLNRIDEINGEPAELVAYVENEMGYMFSQVFAVSAKKAWDGYNEGNESKVKESNMEELYDYLVNNIERNAEQVQQAAILESIDMQFKRDMLIHKNARNRIGSMLNRFNEDLQELNKFNTTLKQIINNKMSEWIDNKFFEEEKQLLENSSSSEEFSRIIKKFSSNDYINSLVNRQYDELNSYIVEEWRNNTEQYIKRLAQEELAVTSDINTHSLMTSDISSGSSDAVEGAKQGGITAGAIGLGLAGYAAWLGPAAAYVSIGSAVAAFLPPLLIVGAIGGAVWKFLGSDKKKVDKYNQIDAFVFEIKSAIKNGVIKDMNENLYQASDYYYNNSSQMVMSILKQCNTSKDEVERISSELERYIGKLEYHVCA